MVCAHVHVPLSSPFVTAPSHPHRAANDGYRRPHVKHDQEGVESGAIANTLSAEEAVKVHITMQGNTEMYSDDNQLKRSELKRWVLTLLLIAWDATF